MSTRLWIILMVCSAVFLPFVGYSAYSRYINGPDDTRYVLHGRILDRKQVIVSVRNHLSTSKPDIELLPGVVRVLDLNPQLLYETDILTAVQLFITQPLPSLKYEDSFYFKKRFIAVLGESKSKLVRRFLVKTMKTERDPELQVFIQATLNNNEDGQQ